MVYCPECGTKNDDNAAFCGNCGSTLNEESPLPAYQDAQDYHQPEQAQGYQQPQQAQGYQQTPTYHQPEGYIPRKDTNLAFIATLFIPGFAYYIIGKQGEGIGFSIAIYICYFAVGDVVAFLGAIFHLYLILTSISMVKKINQANGYPN